MTAPAAPDCGLGVGNDELRRLLGAAVRDRLPGRIAALTCRPPKTWSSARLAEVDVELTNGSVVELLVKDVGRTGWHDRARAVKPVRLHDPLREIRVYRDILNVVPTGAPRLHGTSIDAARSRYWLVLERVPAVELFQVGEFSTWLRVAAWLARAQRALGRSITSGAPSWLVRYDKAFHRQWMPLALEAVRARGVPSSDVRRLEELATRHGMLLERIAALPATFVHGELYPSNLLISYGDDDLRVCPVDWETAGIGPALMDLAALVAGWPSSQQRALAEAYWIALGPDATEYSDVDALIDGLACCRLQRAIQWVAWFGTHSPPDEHAHDWLGETLTLADDLRL